MWPSHTRLPVIASSATTPPWTLQHLAVRRRRHHDLVLGRGRDHLIAHQHGRRRGGRLRGRGRCGSPRSLSGLGVDHVDVGAEVADQDHLACRPCARHSRRRCGWCACLRRSTGCRAWPCPKCRRRRRGSWTHLAGTTSVLPMTAAWLRIDTASGKATAQATSRLERSARLEARLRVGKIAGVADVEAEGLHRRGRVQLRRAAVGRAAHRGDPRIVHGSGFGRGSRRRTTPAARSARRACAAIRPVIIALVIWPEAMRARRPAAGRLRDIRVVAAGGAVRLVDRLARMRAGVRRPCWRQPGWGWRRPGRRAPSRSTMTHERRHRNMAMSTIAEANRTKHDVTSREPRLVTRAGCRNGRHHPALPDVRQLVIQAGSVGREHGTSPSRHILTLRRLVPGEAS